MASSLELRIGSLGSRASSTCDFLPGATVDGSDVVMRCPPNSGNDLNERLVWLWGLLRHQRRRLRTLQAEGATLACICVAPRGPVILLPNAAEFLHLTGATLVINVGAG